MLEALLHDYRERHPEDEATVRRFLALLQDHPDCYTRHCWAGHITGSAWIADPSGEQVLLTHHRKLDRWLQPGGHADGDTDMRQVALKECNEETGVAPEHIRLLGDGIFDVDIHRTQEPFPDAEEHEHIDIRYLVEIDDRVPVPGNEESFGLRWIPIPLVARYSNSRSTLRMLDKTRRMR